MSQIFADDRFPKWLLSQKILNSTVTFSEKIIL